MKDVLIVIESLGCGGAEKSLISLMPEIDYDKYNVDLLVWSKGGGAFESFVDSRIKLLPQIEFVNFCQRKKIRFLSHFNLAYLSARILWAASIRTGGLKHNHPSELYWKMCGWVIPKMKKHYDVAIAWGQGTATYYVSEKVSAEKKIAWINANLEETGHSIKFDFPIYKKMDVLVMVSSGLKKAIKEMFPELENRMTVIYDIINAETIYKMAAKSSDKVQKDTITLVTIGRLVKEKGYHLAIEACNLLYNKGYNIRWYVIGEGSERKNLENLIAIHGLEDIFILMGAMNNPYGILAQADIYVQTSISEGFCISLAEARLFNKPIVTTDFEVVYNQIENEKNGLIVGKNSEEIAKGIERLLKDSGLRESIIKNLELEEKGNRKEVERVIDLLQ